MFSGSLVSIATVLETAQSGLDFRKDRIFQLPTCPAGSAPQQVSHHWMSGTFNLEKSGRRVKITTRVYPTPRLKMPSALSPLFSFHGLC